MRQLNHSSLKQLYIALMLIDHIECFTDIDHHVLMSFEATSFAGLKFLSRICLRSNIKLLPLVLIIQLKKS